MVKRNQSKIEEEEDEEITSEEYEEYEEEGYDDDEDEDEAEEIHDRLLAAIDNFSNHASNKSSSSNVGDNSLSLDTLVNALTDSKDVKIVKKNLEDLEKAFSAPKNIDKLTSNKLERSLNYKNVKQDMTKWQDLVVTNRHAHSLDLAQDKRQLTSHKALISKFKPETDMEKEIQMVLIKTGMTEKAVDDAEQDELRARSMTPEEIREKQAALAKVKALMFYEQMKRHRLNKIKSKAYHRIRKKQKQKQKRAGADGEGADYGDEVDDEEQRERDEKEEMKRVQERMNLKHKNTSRWAQMALKYGRTDSSLRAAYHESVLLGQELTKKIKTTADSSEHQEDDGDYSDAEEAADGKASTSAARSMKRLFTPDASGVDADDEAGQEEGKSRYQKLFDMDFMRKASDKQQERAKLEAQAVLRELQQMEVDVDEDESVEGDALTPEQALEQSLKRNRRVKESQQVVNSLLPSAGSSGMLISKSKGKAKFVMDSTVSLALQHSDPAPTANPWLDAPPSSSSRAAPSRSDTNKVFLQIDSRLAQDSTHDPLPAVSSTAVSNDSHVNRKAMKSLKSANQPLSTTTIVSNKPGKGKKQGNAIDSTAPTSVIPDTTPAPASSSESKAAKNKKQPKAVLLETSQTDLVQMAFAGPELEDEFAALKGEVVDKELGVDDKLKKALSTVKQVMSSLQYVCM